ncbi:MAG: Ig-like domain-containing protein [Clostridia bacterium]|nr:Ig-like domain-containing protein [Clostridia bacterium]
MKKISRFISLMLAAVMLSGLMITANAAGLSDITHHWAKSYIETAVQRGYVTGYDDGTFRPNQPVTRAEFCKMLNNALGLSATANISFKDVSSSHWYYKEVQKAVAAGYIGGYEDNTFLGGNKITRQEAAVVIARIVTSPSSEKNISALKDSGTIASWALSGAKTVYSKGYMAGDNLGNFNPKGNLTRAEAVKIIESILSGEKVSSANLTVSASGQTYSNWIITGNVIISDALASGNVTFNNCRILGTMLINGGGTSGIRLSNTNVSNMTVNSNFQTGIAAVGTSTVNNVYASTTCTLVESNLAGAGTGFKNVTLGGSLNSPTVTLSGAFDKVEALAAGTIKLTSGSVKELSVSSKAAGTTVDLAEDTVLTSATVNASCDFTGEGRIVSVTENADDVSYETLPEKINGEAPSVDPTFEPLEMTFAPKHGTNNFPFDSEIFITFSDKALNDEGKALTSSYIESALELRRSSLNGTKTLFEADITSDGKLITVVPDEPLEPETAYYLVVKEGAFTNASGAVNEEYKIKFTTGEGESLPSDDEDDGEFPIPEVYPIISAKNVPIDALPKIMFSEPVYRADGSALTASYLTGALQLRENTSGGTLLDFTVSLSKDKQTITIIPDKDFDMGTKYYVVIKAEKLSDEFENLNEKMSWSFTTSKVDGIVPEVTPPSGSGSIDRDTEFVFDFGTAIYDDWGDELLPTYLSKYAFTMYEGSTKGNEVDIVATISKDKERITIIPEETLKRGTEYIIVINEDMLLDSSYEPIPEQSFSFVTSGELIDEADELFTVTATSPEKGDTEVAPDSSIILIYPEYLYDFEGGTLTAADVEDWITIRKGSATGLEVPYSVTVSSSKKIIELTPTKNLASGTKYFVMVDEGAFTDKAGNMNAEHTFSFTVGSQSGGTLAPIETYPFDGSTDTSVSTIIMLAFDEPITDTEGNELTSSSLASEAIQIRRGSKTGTKVSFGAAIDTTGTIVTLMPTSKLSEGYIYYVTLLEGTIMNEDGDLNDAYTFTFETKAN